jgi:tetratricopeptide (TPR) repeat protein
MAFNKAKALQEAEKSLAQGKTSQAIKQYLDIYAKDPADPTVLNTVGDIYLREKNVSEALKHFHKLAESYTQEGFTVKAIAIYKKIFKLDPSNVDVLLKTGELYTVQGLSREAREQFTQAVDFLRKKNQNDRAVEAFRKIVALDPDNPNYRAKFAEFCEQAGRKGDAAGAYCEAAEIALRKGDLASAEVALAKARRLEPQDPKILVIRARLALTKNQPGEAEKILTSSPGVKSDPATERLLLEAYLGSKRLDAAKSLVGEVFRANPADFAPLQTFARLCLEKGEYDAAVAALAEGSDVMIQQKAAAPLMEILREIWTRRPNHLPALELIYKVAEKTADEATLPDVLQALGDAYASTGNLDRAEWAFQKLVNREPGNEDYKGLLKGILHKAGKEVPVLPGVAELRGGNIPLTADIEGEPVEEGEQAAPVASAEEAAMVKEALENSDLFSRYNLSEKAVAELEKVLAVYPEQIEIHQRILEVSQKSLPQRAQQAAEALARIYAKRGDMLRAKRYETMAGKELQLEKAAAGGTPAAPVKPEIPLAASSEAAARPMEIDLSSEAPTVPAKESGVEIPLDFSSGAASKAPPAKPAEAREEFDLSEELGTEAAPPAEAPAAPAQFNFEESRVEVDFYLEQGFLEEARKAVAALEVKFPGDAQVAELRHIVEARAAGAPAPTAHPAAPVEAVPKAAPSAGEWDLPTSFSKSPVAADPAAAPPAPQGGDLLGSLAGELASSLEGIGEKTPWHAPSPPSEAQTGAPSPLSGILDELAEGGEGQAAEDDPQTHYDLGVAFREMNLLDEAIGEFQKVVKGAQKGKPPANFLQACTLLALCFMDKKMPVIAAKWYTRALEIPDLDEEATLALLYDLGVAHEQAGNARTALEKFSEVYSQNIDYRDVAEKIRILQQKA